MQRHGVRGAEQLIERHQAGSLDLVQVGIGDQHLRTEPTEGLGNLAPDAPVTDESDGRLRDPLDRTEGADAPPSRSDLGVSLRDLAEEREQQGERVDRDLLEAVVRDVRHDDAVLTRGIQVDVVDTDAIAGDDLAPIEPGDGLPVQRQEGVQQGIGTLGGLDDRGPVSVDDLELATDLAEQPTFDGGVGEDLVREDHSVTHRHTHRERRVLTSAFYILHVAARDGVRYRSHLRKRVVALRTQGEGTHG